MEKDELISIFEIMEIYDFCIFEKEELNLLELNVKKDNTSVLKSIPYERVYGVPHIQKDYYDEFIHSLLENITLMQE